MSSTTTITAVSSASVASTCRGPLMYELPVQDAACGIPNTDDYKSIFESCAYPAAVQAYHSDCALYAPALDQSIQDIIDCLYDAHVDWGDVWCTGGTNSTATGKYETATATPTTKSKSTPTSTLTEEAAKETGSEDDDPNGAVAVRASGREIVALGLLGLLFTVFCGLV
ncbi:uncharacterized protein BDW70DRAFT_132161 [Aspergillus foveolatus]|uniref:uncharacterized protein n=1 Tax=Aspergillus foveolatus TaxID=210207 RepID=UPI003CCCA30D